jgi:rod shape-determining protein MreD
MVAALSACGLLGDAALGVLWPVVTRPPALPIAVVVAVGLTSGVRAGMVTGFATGLVLDLLSGSAAVAGVHALTALTVGAVIGWAHRDHRDRTAGSVALTGALGVCGASGMLLMLQRSLDHAMSDPIATVVVHALAVGAFATPIAQRMLRRSAGWPLSLTSTRT